MRSLYQTTAVPESASKTPRWCFGVTFRVLFAVGLTWACQVRVPLVQAQTLSGHYAAGALGQMKSAILPPPGLVIENGTLIYDVDEFVDGNGNRTTGKTQTVAANRTLLLWTSNKKLFSGDLAVAGIIPVANFPLARPPSDQDKEIGLGDIYVQPFGLGWHMEKTHFTVSYGFFAPTGRFSRDSNDNTGRGFWSHLLSAGMTHFPDPKRSRHVTVSGRYEIHTKQEKTDITPGDNFILEYGLGKVLTEKIDLGVVGYGNWQITDEDGSPPGTDTSKYRFFGIGPDLQLAVVNPKRQMLTSLRTYFEFGARNTSRGIFTVFSFGFRL